MTTDIMGDEHDNNAIEKIQEMVRSCIQCGTCTGSCPNAFAMDVTPRKMWRMVLMGKMDAVFNSKTFILCSSCYCCTLRCPRGLPLTRAMAELKTLAARRNIPRHRQSIQFYKKFLQSVRNNGRLHEMEFMTLYFMSMKNPLIPLKFAPLGAKLMGKGKLAMKAHFKGRALVEPLFQKVDEMENNRLSHE